jgi:hypothetical protein
MTMNKTILALIVGLFIGQAPAHAVQDQLGKNLAAEIPGGKSGDRDIMRKWAVPDLLVIDSSTGTNRVNTFDGTGIVVGICVTTAPAAAFDSAAIDGAGAIGYAVIKDSDTPNATGSIIHRQPGFSVLIDAADGSAQRGGGCKEFPDGLPFTTGLARAWSSNSLRLRS